MNLALTRSYRFARVSKFLRPMRDKRREIWTSVLSPALIEHLWVKLPMQLYSAETFEFPGHTPEVAEKLLQRYKALKELAHAPYGFFDVAKEFMEDASLRDGKSHEDCNLHLTNIGIAESLSFSILHKEFEDLRYTATCDSWLKTVIEIRWNDLRSLNERAVKRLIHHLRIRAFVIDQHASESGSSSTPPDTRTPGEPNRSATESNVAPSSQVGLIPGNVTEDTPLDITADVDNPFELILGAAPNITVWRGGTEVRIKQIYNEITGILDINPMCSAPGDFSGVKRIPYFAMQRETAEEYALFHTALRSGGSGLRTGGIRAYLPTSFAETAYCTASLL